MQAEVRALLSGAVAAPFLCQFKLKKKNTVITNFRKNIVGKKKLRDLHRDAVMPTLARTHEYTQLTGNQWSISSITKGEMSPHPL